jgi:hypothetical protein
MRGRGAMTGSSIIAGRGASEAAFRVMQDAYLAASANGTLPANARQIYYAARPKILQIAERDSLDSQYFCQTLLVDYMQERDVEWDVVWDDRGHFTEPHTGRTIGLGTLNVRNYLNGNGAPDFEARCIGDGGIQVGERDAAGAIDQKTVEGDSNAATD